ncbi:HAAS signaling domain-containing protein [Cellulosilyticum ruminicola]|uniref:HAAS signaling domain-containing protein n=1 Tax=Cellulosilyticum ruminicola TaxID=425254 RepID=UPI0006D0EA90|nr:DUF4097 family beta strand repeat-containing protein [Cellulosilyticum ruminicola]
MNKWEFLQRLRESLTQMPEEEVNAAIRYYEEYFDEAGEENEGRVVKELGSPEQVAKQISAEGGIKANIKEDIKYSTLRNNQTTVWVIIIILSICVIGAAFKKYSSNRLGVGNTVTMNDADATVNGKYIDVDTVVDEFNKIDLNLDMMDVTIKTGDAYKVQIHYYSNDKMTYGVNNKVLKCVQKNDKEVKSAKNEITIYVPQDKNIDLIDIATGMGRNTLIDIKATEINVNSGMGDIDVVNIDTNEFTAQLGMGNAKIDGTILGDINVDNGMGNVELKLVGKKTDYNYDIDGGFGKIVVGGMKAANMADYKEDNGANYKISVDGGMGDIKVDFK